MPAARCRAGRATAWRRACGAVALLRAKLLDDMALVMVDI